MIVPSTAIFCSNLCNTWNYCIILIDLLSFSIGCFMSPPGILIVMDTQDYVHALSCYWCLLQPPCLLHLRSCGRHPKQQYNLVSVLKYMQEHIALWRLVRSRTILLSNINCTSIYTIPIIFDMFKEIVAA